MSSKINRIDNPQSAYQLSRALAEVTRSQVSALTLGRVHPIEGVEGGQQRKMTARINGERKRFIAMEVGGKVSIVDADLGLEANKAHEILKRVDEARERGQAKAQSAKTGAAQGQAQGSVPKPSNNNGWPVRNAAASHPSQAARTNARRR